MKHILVITLVLMILLTATHPAVTSGQEGAHSYQLRRGNVSVTSGEIVSSGRYRQRSSAGDVVAVATLGAAKVNGSLGFWWRPAETPPVDPEPTMLYLPLIFK